MNVACFVDNKKTRVCDLRIKNHWNIQHFYVIRMHIASFESQCMVHRLSSWWRQWHPHEQSYSTLHRRGVEGRPNSTPLLSSSIQRRQKHDLKREIILRITLPLTTGSVASVGRCFALYSCYIYIIYIYIIHTRHMGYSFFVIHSACVHTLLLSQRDLFWNLYCIFKHGRGRMN